MKHRRGSGGPILVVAACIVAATAWADSAPDTPTGDSSQLRSQAEAAYYDEEYTAAVALLDRMSRLQPDDALIAYRLYFVHDLLRNDPVALERSQERARRLLEARARADDDPVALYYLQPLVEGEATLEADVGRRIDRVLQRFDRGRNVPDDLFVLSRLLNLSVQRGRPVEEQWRLLRATLDAGSWSEAPYLFDITRTFHRIGLAVSRLDRLERWLDDAIAARPGDPRLYVARAEFLQERGRSAEARQDVERALSIGTPSQRVLRRGGALLLVLHDFDAALDCFDAYLKQTPIASVWRQRGQAAVALERWNEAEEAYANALLLDENDPFTWIRLGRLLDRTDRPRHADHAFRAALRLRGHEQWVRRAYALFLEDHRRLDEALDVLASERFADRPEAATLEARIRCLWRLDRNAAAIDEARRAIETYPDEAVLHRYLSLALRDRAEPGDAEAALLANAAALRLNGNRDLERERVELLWRAGRRDGALELQHKLVGQEPDHVEGWRRLARMTWSRGDSIDDVLTVLRRALQVHPLDDELVGLLIQALHQRRFERFRTRV